MREITVFFAWQSDIRSTRNRISKALENVEKDLRDEFDLATISAAERASGAPDINHQIRRNIRNSDVVVCDVTPVTTYSVGSGDSLREKSACNSNVMLELGYALGTVGTERVIQVRDTNANGDLPFDIRNARTIDFDSQSGLRKRLAQAIRLCIASSYPLPGSIESRRDVLMLLPRSGNVAGAARAELSVALDQLATAPDEVFALLSDYFRGSPPSGWRGDWLYGIQPEAQLINDLRTAVRPSSSAASRRAAERQMLLFVVAADIHVALTNNKTAIGNMLSSNRPWRESSLVAILVSLENVGVDTSAVRTVANQDWRIVKAALKNLHRAIGSTSPEALVTQRTKPGHVA